MEEKPDLEASLHHTKPHRGETTVTSRFFSASNTERAQKKRLKQAQSHVLRSRNDPRAYLLLAWHLAENNQLQDAVIAWSKGHLLLPFDADIDIEEDGAQAQMNAYSHNVFGDILFKAGAVDQARAEWEKASVLDKYGVGDQARRKLQEHLSTSAAE